MNPLNKQTVTVTITNNVTAHAESITMSIGVRQGAYDEMMLRLNEQLKTWIRPSNKSANEQWVERVQQYYADDTQTSDT